MPDLAHHAITRLQEMIATPSPSRHEAAVVDLVESHLLALKLPTQRIGRNLLATVERGDGPTLMLCSHLDTVPPNPGYTRDPHAADLSEGKLYGLGSNDAGASVVSMTSALAELAERDDWQGSVQLALVIEEEISGREGAEFLLAETGLPDSAIIGEPTGLEVCIAQKGLMVLDCICRGVACHAANAYRLKHRNAILDAAADFNRVSALSFNERDESLGPTTINVTTLHGGSAPNSIPDECRFTLDVRANPAQGLEGVLDIVKQSLQAEVRPRSVRLHPMKTDPDALIVKAALKARPEARTFGSDTLSDMVFLRGCPVIKCGPGISEMSHVPDEWVETRWIEPGIAFYRDTALAFFAANQV